MEAKTYFPIVTLDIQNAFNTANWLNVIQVPQTLGVLSYILRILDSYVLYEILLYETVEGK